MQNSEPRMNHLAKETSPYLLHHATNPVDWYPWGKEAFDRAVNEDKPVLLSIGYSSCHWCHVMAHESFENQEIAKLLNDNFISIKVDREERPEIDHIYMEAVQAMTGRGGWPLTVFLVPDGRPFFGGTYFPPSNRQGMPGFAYILMAMKQAYSENRVEILEQTAELQSALAGVRREHLSEVPGKSVIDDAYAGAVAELDRANGGFGTAPKFPEPLALEFLLRVAHGKTDRRVLEILELTLDRMSRGGIYDHVGGGFHRYSTDNMWRVPHFEKMLYDNALLIGLYLHAYQALHHEWYKAVVCETIDFLAREMKSAEGGFYTALDADSEGIEGKYYLWSKDEIAEAVGKDDLEKVSNYFNVTQRGNFEGSNILYAVGEAQRDEGLPAGTRQKLFEVRQKRVRPFLDRKIIASWNGMMLSSLSEAAAVLGRQDYLQTSLVCAHFIAENLMNEGKLEHVYKDGKRTSNGYLEDYACVIQGFLDLHAVSAEVKWLQLAVDLTNTMVAQFLNVTDGLLYDVPQGSEPLFVRPRNVVDGATPSGSSQAARVLLQLHTLTGDARFLEIAEHCLAYVQKQMTSFPRGFANWLCALNYYLSPQVEIAVIGDPADESTREAIAAVYSVYLPGKVVAAGTGRKEMGLDIELLENRDMVQGNTTVYVCRNRTCGTPITDIGKLVSELKNT
jgi:uncharacterized protein